MAIVASFSVSQSSITPAAITVVDTSTGTYGTITQRRLYVQDAYGNYLSASGGNNYISWDLADLSITESILSNDTAANIKVEWCDINGNVIDTVNNNYPLSEFGKQFFFYLWQVQGLTPGIYQDANYISNMARFWAAVQGGDNAVNNGNSIGAAQNCYNIEIEMQNNQSKYF